MEDVIIISSGSEDESDLDVLGDYEDSKNDSRARIRERPGFPPPFIDLTDCGWAPSQRRCQRRNASPVLVVDLSDSSLPDGLEPDPPSPAQGFARTQEGEQTTVGSPSRLILDFCQRSLDHSLSESCEKGRSLEISGDGLSEPRERSFSHTAVEQLERWDAQDSKDHITLRLDWKLPCASVPETLSDQKGTTGSPRDSFNGCKIPKEFSSSSTFPVAKLKAEGDSENALHNPDSKVRPFSTESHLPETKKEKSEDPASVGDSFPDYPFKTSPISDDSSYYCPSEIDPVLYSDDSSMHESQQDNTSTYNPPPSTPSPSQDLTQHVLEERLYHTSSLPCRTAETESLSKGGLGSVCQPSPGCSPHSAAPNQQLSPASGSHVGSVSPTFTDSLAGDSPDWLVDDAELPTDSPPSPPSLPSSPWPPRLLSTGSEEMERDAYELSPGVESPATSTEPEDSEVEQFSDCEDGLSSREASQRDRRYVSRTQCKKLRQLLGTLLPNLATGNDRPAFESNDEDDSEEEEEFGPAMPLGRQSLSLVYSTMEERYPEGTLQLLSDFLHPRFYPPANVMSHLIRDILLDPECDFPHVMDAFGLLMRIQKHHPATRSTVQWDWELLRRVMDEQRPEKRPPSAVLCMLLQYVLQTLEDDFQLSLQRLPGSIVKATLSCCEQFMNVREVINWLVAAVTKSTGDPEENTSETKILLILQRMLALAMEVDRTPTTSSRKLSQELFHMLSTIPHRRHRLLLLQTLDSRLLRCKLLEILLLDGCREKTNIPMSMSLLLHFLQSSTLPPDPADGSERWRKWSELIQFLWMLLLSYEEVTEGHLRRPITERATCSRAPIRTVNDEITREAVQEAADSFLSRVSADLGHALPPQLQESFALLQNHLFALASTDICTSV